MNKAWVLMGAVVVAVQVQASLISFDLLGDPAMYSALDDLVSGSVTNGGVIATLTASEGVLNRTADGFGINGPGADDTNELNLNQYIDLVFDQAVHFRSINVSSWGTGSAGEVRLGPSFVSQGDISGTGDTAFDFRVEKDFVVRVYATGETSETNGFSFDGFTVEAVPEPVAMGFIALSGLGMLIVKRFRG